MPRDSDSLAPQDGAVGAIRRLRVIRNPVAGQRRGGLFREVLRHLEALGCVVEVVDTAGPGDATRLAAEASPARYDAVVVAGGDGTINEALNGLTGPGGSGLPLAILPLGTANVLAAELGLPNRSADIARLIARGSARPVHLGEANGRRFSMMVGVGFDAHVVASVRPGIKRLIGKGAYVLETLRALLDYRFATYRVAVDGTEYRAASAVVANGHYYGGRFTCAPQASLADPDLHVCLFLRGGRWNAIRYALGLLRGRLQHYRDVLILRGAKVEIDGAEGAAQVDGDVLGHGPVRLSGAGAPYPVIAA